MIPGQDAALHWEASSGLVLSWCWSKRIAMCMNPLRTAQQTPTTLPSGYHTSYNREKVQGWLKKEEELPNTLRQARFAVRAGFDCLRSQCQLWELLVIRAPQHSQPPARILLAS